VFELNLNSKKVKFYAISGMAPDRWITPLWEQSRHQPFQRPNRANRPAKWCSLHIFNSKISLNEENITDPEEVAKKICDWCLSRINDSSTQNVIRIIADQMQALQAAFTDLSK
jgi:hypothetical protein